MKWVAVAAAAVLLLGVAVWWTGLFSVFLPVQEEAAQENIQGVQTLQNDLPTAQDDTSNAALAEDLMATEARIERLSYDITALKRALEDTPLSGLEAEKERRNNTLTLLLARIELMSKVTPEFKQNLTANVSAQLRSTAGLSSSDSFEAHYRVYALVVPQTYIAAAADVEATLINMLAGVGTKLQKRLETLLAAGANVSAQVNELVEMGARLQSAQSKAQSAINGSAVLVPDNGDKEKMEANVKALASAENDVLEAKRDLTEALQIAQKIRLELPALDTSTNSSLQ